MVTCAGVASLPPARDFRIFLGAAILAGAWVFILSLQKHFNSWQITSAFFILDLFYILLFYLISRPSEQKGKENSVRYNWAGYVAAILAMLVAVEITHYLYTNSFYLKPLFVSLVVLISGILFWGFARGFGLRPTLFYAMIIILINLAALVASTQIVNLLTLIAILIILTQGVKGTVKNITHWINASNSR